MSDSQSMTSGMGESARQRRRKSLFRMPHFMRRRKATPSSSVTPEHVAQDATLTITPSDDAVTTNTLCQDTDKVLFDAIASNWAHCETLDEFTRLAQWDGFGVRLARLWIRPEEYCTWQHIVQARGEGLVTVVRVGLTYRCSREPPDVDWARVPETRDNRLDEFMALVGLLFASIRFPW